MIGTETAIRRLAFAEARQVSAEAMVMMATHRDELEKATTVRGITENQATDALADRAETLRHVDKKA